MAKPNFQFEKRKKELERKKKNEEKQQRKQARGGAADVEEITDNSDRGAPEDADPI